MTTLPEGATQERIAAHVQAQAAALRTKLDDVADRIRRGDIPLERLERLVPGVIDELSTTKARAVGFERAIAEMRSDARVVQLGTTAIAVLAGVGAAFASGGTAIALGVIGTAAGVGGAAHELELADDLVDVSEASLTGADAMVDSAGAKQSYRAAVVNLALAAVDAVLAGRAIRGLRATALAKAPAEVVETLGRLSPRQLKLVQRAAAADGARAERLMAELADDLEPGLFADVKRLVEARRTARAAMPKMSDAAFDELYASFGPEQLTALSKRVGPDRLAALQKHAGAERLAKLVARHGDEAFVRAATTLGPQDATRLLQGLRRAKQPLGALLESVDPAFLLARLDDVGARALTKQVDALGPKGMAHAIEAMGEDGAAAWLRSKPSGATMNRLAKVRSLKDEVRLFDRADPSRAVLGPGRLSNPEEWNAIIAKLEAAGVQVEMRPGAMAYGPRSSRGAPGNLVLDPDASITALKHEYRHFLDDQAAGYPGMARLLDPDVRIGLERRANDVEIRYMRELGFESVAKQLESNFDAERSLILGETTP